MSQSATPATQNDMTTCLETFEKERFAVSPIDTELTTPRRPDANPTTTRRRPDEQLEANKGPAPRPPDYKREPFATHSGKRATFWDCNIRPFSVLQYLLSANLSHSYGKSP